MVLLEEAIAIYLLGGLTFLPILGLTFYIFFMSRPTEVYPKENKETKANINPYIQQEKSGWIRLTQQYKPKGATESNVAVLMSGIQSYVQGSRRQRELVYAELKCGALFVYESDNLPQEECKIIIPVHNYDVSIFPTEEILEHEIFGKSVAIKLKPKTETITTDVRLDQRDDAPYFTTNNELYITCARPIDKEDWYFGLLAASNMMESPNAVHVEMMDTSQFKPASMQTLINTVQKDAEYREVQWLNAITGRLFLGLYKTEDMRNYVQDKIAKKVQKAKRPSFLGEITVQSVDIGESIPYVTQPKLLSLTPEGDLMAEATIAYAGGLRVVIKTDFSWTYSSLMKPIRVPLVLSIMLKQLSGKLLFKIKPPPTNRCWVGFCEMPTMEWKITPVVSDKQIRLSVVSNAIQSKIREFVMESIVLPNMEDFPFGPSQGKGGIFGEKTPKPSPSELSPELSPNGIDLDLLGNKLPTAQATPVVEESECNGVSRDSISIPSHDQSNPTSPSPLIVDSFPVDDVIPKDIRRASASSIMTTSTRYPPVASESVIRKRRQSFELADLKKEDMLPASKFKEDVLLDTKLPLQPALKADSAESGLTMTPSSMKSKTSSNSLLSKLSQVNKSSNKPNNSKKNALYSMAGNLFNKKKVSKEIREERNQELLESHNRKMTQLFMNGEQQKNEETIPPKRLEENVASEGSMCSLSSDDIPLMCDSPSSSDSSDKELLSQNVALEPVKLAHQNIMVLDDDEPLLSHYRNKVKEYHLADQHRVSL